MVTDTVPQESSRPGLRERKKLETRDALATSAMQLAMKHGLDRIRVEDIALAANMSMRTFNNYFSNKYEAVAARYVDRMRHTACTLLAWPATAPLWDAIIGSIIQTWSAIEQDQTADIPSHTRLRSILSTRSTQGEIMLTAFDDENPFTLAVAQRTRMSPDDLYPKLVTAVVTAVSQVAINRFLQAEPPVPLAPLLREVLLQVAAGLPDPSTGPAPAG